MRSSGFLPVQHALGFVAEGALTSLYSIASCLSRDLSRDFMRIGVTQPSGVGLMRVWGKLQDNAPDMSLIGRYVKERQHMRLFKGSQFVEHQITNFAPEEV